MIRGLLRTPLQQVFHKRHLRRLQRVSDGEVDARHARLEIDARTMRGTGVRIDFETDEKPPRY